MEADLQREEMIFDAALAIEDAVGRRTFLENACRGDAALLARVEKLLGIHEQAEDFFVGCVAGMKPVLDEADAAACDMEDEQSGRWVGKYKLLQKIGEGGWGVVYMAEQEKPVRRRVALKIVKLGMDTRQVITRFEAERQALAMMDHPNIARVLDAAATETGRPYFVMELVNGVKITTFCDERKLDTGQRLDLFIRVCQAIQHAHQKGIIHRDIKPSNILVTLQDGVPVPKVIDFGIAKAIETPLTDKTLFTAFGHFVGTPAYMSPEQADLSATDVDTRTDIYSLGVLLYELLTGRTPFDYRELMESGLDAMRRTLREKEPHRPSTRLGELSTEELTATALHRQSEPPKLKSLLNGDLDWIVMKALEKDRSRRYETPNALLMDVQRHLNNEPVLARPPSRLYRFRKLVRRNQVAFAAAAAVTAALIAGFGFSTWSFVKEREARQRAVLAEQQQARLRREAETGRKITQARVSIGAERFAEADELMRGLELSGPSMEGAAVFRSLAEWHALRRRWTEAADRFSTLTRINQLDGWNFASMDYLGLGAALLAGGNDGAFGSFREAALARFAQTANPFEAERILKLYLMKPVPMAAIPQLDRLASIAAPKTPATLTVQSLANAAWPKKPSGSIGPDSAGLAEGLQSAQDTTPPAVLGAYSYDGLTLGVEFSERIDPVTAADVRNYSIVDAVVTNVTLGADMRSAVLRLQSRLSDEFAVTVSGVIDSAGNSIAAGSTAGNRTRLLRLQDMNSGQPLRVSYDGHRIIMEAGGADIWETVDQFGFAYYTVSGDFDVRLRVHSVQPALDRFTRSGLMARDSLSNRSSRHVMVGVNSENSFQVLVRMATGAGTASLPPDPLPTAYGSNSWVRLQRAGSVFHAYSSRDGIDWVQLLQFDSSTAAEGPFADPIQLGIATSAHSTRSTVTAVLSELGPTPAVSVNATLAFALLEYRRREYANAAEWSRRCLAHPEYNGARVAAARAILAMTLREAGDTAAARAQLEQAREMVDFKLSRGLDLGGGGHGFWFDWVFAQTLLGEAQTAMDGTFRTGR